MKCPYCEGENDLTNETCVTCGKPLHRRVTGEDTLIIKCRRCSTEHRAGFCPGCGRWNGPAPGGFKFLSVLSFVNAGILLLTGLLAIAQAQYAADARLYIAQAVALPVLAAASLFSAFNFLRVKQWALTVIRIVLIVGIAVAAAGLIASFFQSLNPVNFINLMTTVLVNALILNSLREKNHLFSKGDAKPRPEVAPRRCGHCGNEDLTTFDRICPEYRKELS
ncbi:MAG: hypothetical protein JXD23_03710 [Spirochaetales bacterium]|nr:hypothetical protein [Spirochaetales bacterium]